MLGININCKNKDYIGLILDGKKIIETRECKSLHPYIGKRIGLIETGKGKALLRGYATITAVCMYENEHAFCQDSNRHMVFSDDDYAWNNKTKYGYYLDDVVSCVPRYITSKGIIARQIHEDRSIK